MTKKLILVLALTIIVVSGVFAQDEFKHWISGEISLLGAGFRYENMVLPKLSIGANVAFNWLWFWWDFTATANVRGYITDFFSLGCGLGFGYTHSWWSWFGGRYGAIGVAIVPDIGFRFNIKSVPGFFVAPGIKFPLVVGRGFSFGVTGYVGLGYAFN